MLATLPPYQGVRPTPAEHAPNHTHVTPRSWWYDAVVKQMGPDYYDRLKISLPSGQGHTRLISALKVPEYCEALLAKRLKIYVSYSTFKPVPEWLKRRVRKAGQKITGQREEWVDYAIQRCIDLDGVATDEQLRIVSAMFPSCKIIRSNGIQVFFEVESDWETESPILVALGEEAARRTGLTFDTSCHLRDDGSPGDHLSHAFRAPFGWSSKRNCPVEAYLPLLPGVICTPREALEVLNLEVPAPISIPEPAPENPSTGSSKRGVSPHKRMRGTIEITTGAGRGGSLGKNHDEFSEILKARVSLMKQGLTRAQAEGRILSMEWEYHTSSQLQTALQQRPVWVGKGRDGKPLSEKEFQSLTDDFALHQNYLISPPPRIQRKLQKTWTLAAHRAWSLNFFYAAQMDAEECMTAFFNWNAYKTLRALSLKALPRQAIEDDIRVCWAKFYKGYPIKDSAVAAVRIAISDLKRSPFKASEVPEVPEIKSLRQLQQALKNLCEQGFIKKVGKGRGTHYQVIQQPNKTEVKNP